MPCDDVISKVSIETGLSKDKIRQVLDVFSECLKNELNSSNRISIPELGLFRKTITKERKGKNLRTNEVVLIPKKARISFKPSVRFKENLTI